MIAGRDASEAGAAAALLAAGARFGFVHGSRAGTSDSDRPRPDSDLDIAAWWGHEAPQAWDVPLAGGVELVVLDRAPLWLAGRVAMRGRLLFAADPAAERERVEWQVDVRMRYLDELPAIQERYALRSRQIAAGLVR